MVKEKNDMSNVKSKMQVLEESLLDKTRLLEFKIQQLEGTDSEDEEDKVPEHKQEDKPGIVPVKINSQRSLNQDNKELSQPKNLKDMVKNLTINNKKISDQVDKLQFKVDSQSVDLFNRVRRDINGNIDFDTFLYKFLIL